MNETFKKDYYTFCGETHFGVRPHKEEMIFF